MLGVFAPRSLAIKAMSEAPAGVQQNIAVIRSILNSLFIM